MLMFFERALLYQYLNDTLLNKKEKRWRCYLSRR